MVFVLKSACVGLLAALVACSAPRPGPGSSEPAAIEAPAQPPTAAVAPAQPPAQDEAAPATPEPDSKPDASGWGVAAGIKYLEIVRGEASADEPLPMLIVMHGLGDRPHRGWLYAVDIDPKLKARMILPQAPTPHGSGYAWFPFRFQDRDDTALAGGISQAAAGLARMLEQLRVQRPTLGRAVVSGFSQGGMLSFALALTHPELIHFALPISGELPPPLWPTTKPKRGSTPRMVALHGTADTVVSFEADEKLIQHLRKLGYAVELLPYAGVQHQISEDMSARIKRELSVAIRSTH